MPRASTKTTPEHARARFLEVLSQTANISMAARAAAIDRTTPYGWREQDSEFAAKWDQAIEQAIETLEAEAWRRAVEGTKEPIIGRKERDKDGIITYVKRYSDTLLVTLLKAHKPEKYREKVDHEHRGSIAVEFVNNWREQAND